MEPTNQSTCHFSSIPWYQNLSICSNSRLRWVTRIHLPQPSSALAHQHQGQEPNIIHSQAHQLILNANKVSNHHSLRYIYTIFKTDLLNSSIFLSRVRCYEAKAKLKVNFWTKQVAKAIHLEYKLRWSQFSRSYPIAIIDAGSLAPCNLHSTSSRTN